MATGRKDAARETAAQVCACGSAGQPQGGRLSALAPPAELPQSAVSASTASVQHNRLPRRPRSPPPSPTHHTHPTHPACAGPEGAPVWAQRASGAAQRGGEWHVRGRPTGSAGGQGPAGRARGAQGGRLGCRCAIAIASLVWEERLCMHALQAVLDGRALPDALVVLCDGGRGTSLSAGVSPQPRFLPARGFLPACSLSSPALLPFPLNPTDRLGGSRVLAVRQGQGAAGHTPAGRAAPGAHHHVRERAGPAQPAVRGTTWVGWGVSGTSCVRL